MTETPTDETTYTFDPYVALRVREAMLTDTMKARMACANRVRSGGVDPAEYEGQMKALEGAEEAMRKALVQVYRSHVAEPIQAWVKDEKGIGEHLVARLLGNIGHPRIARPFHWEANPDFKEDKASSEDNPKRLLVPDEPYLRSVGQLWSYCGVGDPDRKRRKGMDAEDALKLGRPAAKTVTWLLASSVMKQSNTTYRPIYDAARSQYEDREEWTKGHRHAAALRRVSKAILKDLWIVSGEDTAALLEFAGQPTPGGIKAAA
jgi:hypothetical protein